MINSNYIFTNDRVIIIMALTVFTLSIIFQGFIVVIRVNLLYLFQFITLLKDLYTIFITFSQNHRLDIPQ